MFSRFLKPKWQHKDPKIRMIGIDSLNSSETLVELANHDPEQSVQAAAIKKLNRIEDLLKITANDVLQLQIDLRISNILINNPLTAFTPEIGQQLARMANTNLNEKLATQSFDADIRNAAAALVSDKTVLSKLAVEDSSHEVRLTAASLLDDEAIIHRTLKHLGKKDKRVSKKLRGNLESLAAQKALNAQLDKTKKILSTLGNDGHWKRDQTRLQTIINQTTELLVQVNQSEQSQFKLAAANAEQRIEQQIGNSKALQPIIDAKASQCQLIEDFYTNLKKRHRVSINEADEFSLTLDALLDDWDEIPVLEEKQEIEFSNRFHHGLTQARGQITKLQSNSRQSHSLEKCVQKAEQLQKQKTINAVQIKRLKQDWDKQIKPQDEQLAAEYQQQFSQLCDTLEKKLEKQEQITAKSLTEINQWLDNIETTLATDKLGDAEALSHKVQSALRQQRELPQAERQKIQQRLQDINPKIRELSGWRHWGTDRAREELIDEAIVLKDRQQSIEDRASAIKLLRKRWKDLGKIDPVSHQRLWKKFDTACTEAYSPCKEYFSKQAEQRQQHLKQRKQICSKLESLASETDWSSPDWRAIDKHFHQLRNQWRNTGSVSKKDWNTVYKRFNTAVDSVDKYLQDERRINLNQRQALIEKLQALAESEDLNDAIKEARELQKQWQPTVTAKRSDENKMWKQFRAASDAVFDRKKQKQQAENLESQKLVEAKEELCAEFEDQILDKNISAGDTAKFEDRWAAIGYIHNKEGTQLNHRFNKAKKSAEVFLQAKKLEQRKQLIEQVYQRKIALDQFQQNEDRAEFESLWSGLENINDVALLEQFDALYQSALMPANDGNNTTQNDSDLLLLDLEIALELESPSALKEQRMTRQVERLANKLSDGNSNDSHQQCDKNFIKYCLTKTEKSVIADSNRLKKIKNALGGK